MMSIRSIVKYPAPVLRQSCRRVDEFDDELRRLAQDMVETMHAAPGIGLAAPQVGVDLRLIAVDLSVGAEPDDLLVLANPEVEVEEGETRDEEGCLSFPELVLVVPRPRRIVVSAQDVDGEEIRFEAEELLARCLHHEIDHVDGVLFIDRVSTLKRDLTRRRIDKRIRAGDW